MKRIHLFEFEDLEWFPSALRNYMTDYLQFISNKAQIYEPIVGLLIDKFKKTKTSSILDLASGGGGGLMWLNSEILKEIPDFKITLTDYFPNHKAFMENKSKASNFDYIDVKVDARNVPENLKGFRTQFLSFHHFKPVDAKKILQNAVDAKTPIGIFEAQDRSFSSILGMIISPIGVLLSTPLIKPLSIARIFFTYFLPILPILVMWDGVISCFRTYSPSELKILVNELTNSEKFDWEIGIKKEKMKKVIYLIGIPKTL